MRSKIRQCEAQSTTGHRWLSALSRTDCFNFEDSTPLGNQIKVLINRLEENEDLCRLPGRAPRCEAGNICEENSTVWEEVSDRLVMAVWGELISIQESLELVIGWHKCISLSFLILLCLHCEKTVANLFRLE